ncbi:exocyst complex component 8-like [Paramacrobiotus metropolitanus]|uniref:exocyst complex component 8-like n=1 Tax=Paramacrobiotus metropolitanus TaxID=2943436 RepID=UPI0024464DBC|nr:exocyst complex component 8-like [Paramacrobiotus metropolitanus]
MERSQRTDIRERLYNRDFDPNSEITNLISRGNGVAQIEATRRRFAEHKENAVLELRKNAFKYHNVIINASKEMQQLEKNLADLKATLVDEKTALDNAVETSEEALVARRGAGNRRAAIIQTSSLDGIVKRFRTDEETETHEDSQLPLWFKDAATDMEDHYEMRNFVAAVRLLGQAREFYQALNDQTVIAQAEPFYRMVLEVEEGLIERLLQGLKSAMECPFGVDTKLCQQFAEHLKLLNRSYEAGITFLDNHTRMLKLTVSGIKMEGSIPVYMKKRSEAFFKHLSKTVLDYEEFGFQSPKCKSALTGWVRFHLTTFLSQHEDLLFTDSPNLSVAAECIKIIRESSNQATLVGMDITALLDSCMEDNCVRLIAFQVDRFAELQTTALQGAKMQPTVFDSKEALKDYLDRFASSGLGLAVAYVGALFRNTAFLTGHRGRRGSSSQRDFLTSSVLLVDDGLRLNISSDFIDFAKQFLQFACDIMDVCPSFLMRNIQLWLQKTFSPCLKSLQVFAAKTSDNKVNPEQVIAEAVVFKGALPFHEQKAVRVSRTDLFDLLKLRQRGRTI